MKNILILSKHQEELSHLIFFLSRFLIDDELIRNKSRGLCFNFNLYHLRNTNRNATLLTLIIKKIYSTTVPIEGSKEIYLNNENKYTGEFLRQRRTLALRVLKYISDETLKEQEKTK